MIESNRRRYLTVEQELEHNVSYGDASELWVLERAGHPARRHGDRGHRRRRGQHADLPGRAREVPGRAGSSPASTTRATARTSTCSGIKPSVSATDLILRLLEHEVPEYGLVHLLDLQEEQLEIIEMLLGKDSGVTGRRVGDLEMPEGSLLISVLRSGKGFVPGPDTVLEAGDEVLAVLDPGKEDDLKALFGPERNGNGNGG